MSPPLDPLERVARELVTHPTFGDATSIRERSAAFGDLALRMLAREGDGARALLDALDAAEPQVRRRTLLDAVIRDAIARASDGEELDEIFAAAAERVVATGHCLAFDHVVRVGESAAYVWDDRAGPVDDHFKRMFDELMADNLAQGRVKLRPATSNELDLLDGAMDILKEVVPEAIESVMRHVDVIAIIDAASEATTRMVDSCSWVRFPSTVFLSPLAFKFPVHTADILFHEATHHKHYDLRRSRTILSKDYVLADAVRIVAEWNPPTPDADLERYPDDNRWPTGRAISAGHVYVHLALFFTRLAELRDERTAPIGERARTCTERARYLMNELATRGASDLGPDGLALVAWLSACIEPIERAIADW